MAGSRVADVANVAGATLSRQAAARCRGGHGMVWPGSRQLKQQLKRQLKRTMARNSGDWLSFIISNLGTSMSRPLYLSGAVVVEAVAGGGGGEGGVRVAAVAVAVDGVVVVVGGERRWVGGSRELWRGMGGGGLGARPVAFASGTEHGAGSDNGSCGGGGGGGSDGGGGAAGGGLEGGAGGGVLGGDQDLERAVVGGVGVESLQGAKVGQFSGEDTRHVVCGCRARGREREAPAASRPREGGHRPATLSRPQPSGPCGTPRAPLS